MQNSKLKFKIKIFFVSLSDILFSSALIFLFFLSRLVNLTIIPVFADEAIYIRWAQVMRAVASLRFIPLSDGKQPFFMWLVIPFLKIFSDPLVAGRMVSVLSGLGTMAGIFVLSYLLFKNKYLSLFSALLYVISPFAFFFDRMALADGLLSFFGIWFLIFSILTVAYRRLDCAMIAGILLGLGLITKSPAMIFAILMPFSLILFPCHSGLVHTVTAVTSDPESIRIKKNNLLCRFPIGSGMTWELLKTFGLMAVIYLFAFAIYNILRLGPEFHMIAIRNKDYVFSFPEILKHPLNPFWGNFKDAVLWNFIFTTPLVFVSGLLGIYLCLKRNFKQGLLLLTWWIVPILAQSLIAKAYTSRYIFYTLPYFLIFVAYFIEKLFSSNKSKVLTTLLLFVIFILPVTQIGLLLFSPQSAFLPRTDRSGYLEGWTAGYGIKESADHLKEVAQTQKILVGTEGYFGTLPDGLQIYLEKVPNITVIGVGYPIKEISKQLTSGLIDNQVFLLVNDSRFQVADTSKLELIGKYPKAENPETETRENLLFWKVLK